MQRLFAAATETDRRSRREIALQCLIALAIFVAALCLYTRHNDFPFYYHADEPSKVAQIRDDTRNFNHPLLLLTVTDLVHRFGSGTTDCQQIVEIGRTCSAVFAAAAAALFSWLGFNRFGLLGGAVTGGIMLLQRRLYEHAHFMKEDAALLLGIALTFVAMDAFWRRPTWVRALLLGGAVAVAASGKYVGIIMLPLALTLLIARRATMPAAWKSFLAALVGLLAVLALLNPEAVRSLASVTQGVGGEISRLNTRAGMKWSFSPLYWTRTFLDLSPLLLLAFVFHLRFTWTNFRRLPLPDLLLTVFPFVFGLMLSFSSKQSGRHTLPILLVSVFISSVAAIRAAQLLSARQVRSAGRWIAIFAVAAVAYDAVRLKLMDGGFARDYRRDLIAWITANVPRETTVGVDDRVGLPFGDRDRFCQIRAPIPQQVRGAEFVADLGTFDELRASGITHVIVSEARYYAVTNGQARPSPPPNNKLELRAEFFRRLFQEGRLVWSREPGNVGVLNPGLRLYEIAPPASARLP